MLVSETNIYLSLYLSFLVMLWVKVCGALTHCPLHIHVIVFRQRQVYLYLGEDENTELK
jgi:hypothetical protein